MAEVLLDTDILSNLMRSDPTVVFHAGQYLTRHGRFTFSIITRYEILRGLKAKGATAPEARFNRFCMRSSILGLSDAIIEEAAAIYADLYKRGAIIGDADILIAATARVHGLIVNTNNRAHFGRVRGIGITNWLEKNT